MSVRSAFKCLVVVAVAWSGLVRAAPAETLDSLTVSFASPLGSKVSSSSSSAKIALVEVGSESLTLVSTREIGPITESILSLSSEPVEKRGLVDLRGAKCTTQCGFASGPIANTDDCAVVYKTLYNQSGSFTINPKTIVHWNYNNCAAYFINNSGDSITYDYLDYGGVSQWLNGYCVKDRGATIGTCLFDRYSDFSSGVYGSVNHPNYFGNASNSTSPPAGGTTPNMGPDSGAGTNTTTTTAAATASDTTTAATSTDTSAAAAATVPA